MEISRKQIEEMDVLVLKGRLDSASAKELKGTVDALARENRVKLIIDMAGVDFIDSSGLGSLVSSLRKVNEKQGEIKMVALQKQVRSVFELTRLHCIFDIVDDVEAALRNF